MLTLMGAEVSYSCETTCLVEEESEPNLMSEGEDVVGLDAKMDSLYSF